MKIAKKSLTYTAIISMGIAVALLITAVFNVNVFEGILFKVLLSVATIAVASAFSINAINFMSKRKILSWICIGLLASLTIMGLIIYWGEIKAGSLFVKITSVIAITTILFNIIISTNIKLFKRYTILQWICYGVIIIVDGLITAMLFGLDLFGISGLWQVFIVACLVAFALISALGILGRKTYNADDVDEKGEKYIKIKESEYKALLDKIKQLESKIK